MSSEQIDTAVVVKKPSHVALLRALAGAFVLGTTCYFATSVFHFEILTWKQWFFLLLVPFIAQVVEERFDGAIWKVARFVKIISWIAGATIATFVLLFIVSQASGIRPINFYHAIREQGGLVGAFWSANSQRTIAIGLILLTLVAYSVWSRRWSANAILVAFFLLIASWAWLPQVTAAALSRRHNADEAVSRSINEKGIIKTIVPDRPPKPTTTQADLDEQKRVDDLAREVAAVKAKQEQQTTAQNTFSEATTSENVSAPPAPVFQCDSHPPSSENGGDAKVELCQCTKATPRSNRVSCTGFMTNVSYPNQQMVWATGAIATDDSGNAVPISSMFSSDGGFGFCGNSRSANLAPGVRTKFCLWFNGAAPDATTFAFTLNFQNGTNPQNGTDNTQLPQYNFLSIPVVSVSQ